jgi:hypothetical protein
MKTKLMNLIEKLPIWAKAILLLIFSPIILISIIIWIIVAPAIILTNEIYGEITGHLLIEELKDETGCQH